MEAGKSAYCTILEREQTMLTFFFLTQLSPENVSVKLSLIVLAIGKESEGMEKF